MGKVAQSRRREEVMISAAMYIAPTRGNGARQSQGTVESRPLEPQQRPPETAVSKPVVTLPDVVGRSVVNRAAIIAWAKSLKPFTTAV